MNSYTRSSCVSACAILRIAQEWGTPDISFLAQLLSETMFGQTLRVTSNLILQAGQRTGKDILTTLPLSIQHSIF